MSEIAERPAPPPLWELCIEHVLRFLGVALSVMALYLAFNYVFQFYLQRIDLGILDLAVIAVATMSALAAALYWNRNEEKVDAERMHERLHLVVRYFLAYIFVCYGLAKLYRTQLYEPFQEWLDTPLGELSGFALTWSFFGVSFAYSSFIGLSQILCSLLLCYRRTQLLGALMLLPIIGNIVIVNFSYGVPVRLYSSIFLLMTVYLVLSDFRRLKAFFWDHAAVPARPIPAVSAGTRKRNYIFKYATLVAIFAVNVWQFESMTAQMPYVVHPVFGVWEVESYEAGGEVVFEKADPGGVWTKLVFEAQGGGHRAKVELGSKLSRFANYTVGGDRTLKITLSGSGQKEGEFEGRYELDGNGGMVLTGEVGEQPVRIELRRKSY